MAAEDKDKLTLEKLKLDHRLGDIEEYVIEGNKLKGTINDTLTALNLKIFGDPKASLKIDRDGLERRIEALEGDKKNHIKLKDNLLKIAVGAITLAVGSFVIWMWKIIVAGFHAIKGG